MYGKVPTQALRHKFDSIQRKITDSVTRHVVGIKKTTTKISINYFAGYLTFVI